MVMLLGPCGAMGLAECAQSVDEGKRVSRLFLYSWAWREMETISQF